MFGGKLYNRLPKPDGVLVLVTAPNADFRTINRMLAYRRSWFGFSATDLFYIKTTKDAKDFGPTLQQKERTVVTTTIAGQVTPQTFINEWSGCSIDEVEDFARNGWWGVRNIRYRQFVLLDELDMKDETVTIFSRLDDYDDGTYSPSNPARGENGRLLFDKLRVPWRKAWDVCANLQRIRLKEYCQEDLGCDEGRYWHMNEDLLGQEMGDTEERRERTNLLRELSDAGLV